MCTETLECRGMKWLMWDKLAIAKKKKEVNVLKSLQLKQCLAYAMYPYSLVACLYKVFYSPRCDLSLKKKVTIQFMFNTYIIN